MSPYKHRPDMLDARISGKGKLAIAFLALGAVGLAIAGRYLSQRDEPPDSPDSPSAKALPDSPSAVADGAKHISGGRDKNVTVGALPVTARARNRLDSIAQGVAPSASEWPTEAFSEKATKQLYTLAKALEHPRELAQDQIADLVTNDFHCDPLRAGELVGVHESDAITVLRRSGDSRDGPQRRHALGFYTAIRELMAGIEGDARAAFKIVRVQGSDSRFETEVFAEGGGRTSGGRRQWSATWKCNWVSDVTPPRLREISLEDYEEVAIKSSQPWLMDETEAVLGQANGYREQLLYGMDYWVNRLEHRLHVNRLGHHGLAVGDVNHDGRDDLYVCQPGGLPNRLYVHQADGTAVDNARESGVDFLDDTTCALLADLDNDGDQDLGLLTVTGGFILSNDGHGHFHVEATLPECRNTFSLTAADYDRDGLLDLYVGRYWPEEERRGAIPVPVPYYDAQNGGANLLLRNAGKWDFVDVTDDVGLDSDNSRYTMAAAWEDYDNDGDPDLYVANDFGRNCLYRNDDGHFLNVAAQAGVEDTAAGMSVSWSDYNQDGLLDVYVGNMFSSAGNRVAYQRQYEDRFDAESRAKLQRLARGNSLFRNDGNGSFTDVSLQSATTMGRWAWGSLFVDLNNDSWDDLVVANGHITTQDTGDL